VSGSIAGLEAGAEVDLVVAGQVLDTLEADADGVIEFSLDVGDLAGALVAVGVTFNVECGDSAVLGEGVDRPGASPGAAPGAGPGSGSDVLGSGTTGGPGSSSGASGGSADGSGSGALARTGVTIAPLVVLALIALAVGAYLRRRSRDRQGRLAV
jgi:hypothetical protein